MLMGVLLKYGALMCGAIRRRFHRALGAAHSSEFERAQHRRSDIREEMSVRKLPLDDYFDQRGWSPLHVAAKYWNVAHNAKDAECSWFAIDGENDYNHSACSSRFLRWVDAWPSHSALHVAVASDMRQGTEGSTHSLCSTVKLLLDFGASLDMKNSIGATPRPYCAAIRL